MSGSIIPPLTTNLGDIKDYVGIYIIRNRRTSAFYVGQSRNIKTRIRWHLNSFDNGTSTPRLRSGFLYGSCDAEFGVLEACGMDSHHLDELELKWITQLNPPLNTFVEGRARSVRPMSSEWKFARLRPSATGQKPPPQFYEKPPMTTQDAVEHLVAYLSKAQR